MSDIKDKPKKDKSTKSVKSVKPEVKGKTFATFCKQHKIAEDSVKWRTISDKSVKISIDKSDFENGGWNLISVGIMFALRELGVGLDVTIRANAKDVEIIVEK
jgi:hypothetical protein